MKTHRKSSTSNQKREMATDSRYFKVMQTESPINRLKNMMKGLYNRRREQLTTWSCHNIMRDQFRQCKFLIRSLMLKPGHRGPENLT